MNKFKIGDRVRLINNTTYSKNNIGDTGIVRKGIGSRYSIDPDHGSYDPGNCWSEEDDLELCTETYKIY